MRNIIKQILKEEIDSKSERIKSIVNRYGYNKAIELLVGNKHTIRKAYKDNPKSYLDQFNNLTPVEKNDKIYYVDKDGKLLFMYYPNKINGNVYINDSRIWAFFENILLLRYNDVKFIINNWLEEVYGITGLIPLPEFW